MPRLSPILDGTSALVDVSCTQFSPTLLCDSAPTHIASALTGADIVCGSALANVDCGSALANVDCGSALADVDRGLAHANVDCGPALTDFAHA